MNATINNRVALARELAEVFSHSLSTVHHGNGEIVDLLFGGNDEESPLLPGESAEAIRANLERVLELASQPTPVAIGGRNREQMRRASELQRSELRIFCRTAIALLETDHATTSATSAEPAQAIPASVQLSANAAPYAQANIEAVHGLVSVFVNDNTTRLNLRLEVNADTARALAAALVQAADLADKEAAQ